MIVFRGASLTCSLIVGASLILCLQASLQLLAQPVQTELSELQRQMHALQIRINEVAQQSDARLPGGDNDSSRVRSIGVQQAVEAPPPVVIDEVYVKLYDLSDLFSVSVQYPASPPSIIGSGRETFDTESNYQSSTGLGGGGLGGGGLGGSGAFNVASTPGLQDADNMPMADVQVSLKKLVQAIKSTIDPDQWEAKSRDSNSITILGNMLLVSAKDSQQNKIANLIDLFREQWGARRTIAVRLWWIRADLKTIDQLTESQPQTDGDAGVLDDVKWKSFYEAAAEENRMLYSIHFSGHNGQTLHSWSGRNREQVVSAEPIFSETINRTEDELMTQKVVGLNPVLNQLFEGAIAQVTPMSTRGGNFAILDLHSLVQKL